LPIIGPSYVATKRSRRQQILCELMTSDAPWNAGADAHRNGDTGLGLHGGRLGALSLYGMRERERRMRLKNGVAAMALQQAEGR
jgi:hypothetical protein